MLGRRWQWLVAVAFLVALLIELPSLWTHPYGPMKEQWQCEIHSRYPLEGVERDCLLGP